MKGGKSGCADQGRLPGPPGTLFQTPGSQDLGKELCKDGLAATWLAWVPPHPQSQPAGSEARPDLSMTPGMEPGLVEALEAQ